MCLGLTVVGSLSPGKMIIGSCLRDIRSKSARFGVGARAVDFFVDLAATAVGAFGAHSSITVSAASAFESSMWW